MPVKTVFLLNIFTPLSVVFACVKSPQDELYDDIKFISFILVTVLGNIFIIYFNNKKNKYVGKIIGMVLLFTIIMYIIYGVYKMATATFCS